MIGLYLDEHGSDGKFKEKTKKIILTGKNKMHSTAQEIKRQKEKDKNDKLLMARIFNEITAAHGIQDITGSAQPDDFLFHDMYFEPYPVIFWEKSSDGEINGQNRITPPVGFRSSV